MTLRMQIKALERELSAARDQIQHLRNLNALTVKPREWFTIPNPLGSGETVRHLWILDKEHPFTVCALGPGDVLFIGRAPQPRPDL